MEHIRTYQVYAGLTFLGYEYAADKEDALTKTQHKYGHPRVWQVEQFTATIIKWPGEYEDSKRATEEVVA